MSDVHHVTDVDDVDDVDDVNDAEPDDLVRVLGYVDAVDPADDLVEVGPDLLLTPCWTPAFCAALVRAAEATGAFEPHPDDPVPGHEVSLMTISPVLFHRVQADFSERIWPRLQAVWPLIDDHGLRDAFVIRYAPGEQEALRLHHDIAQVSATVRLNDAYEGAELAFPRQRYSNGAQPVGSMLAWPSLVTHPHETLPLTAGVKYGLTVWFELPTVVDGA